MMVDGPRSKVIGWAYTPGPWSEVITHRRLAKAFGVSAQTIRRWVETGAWSLPSAVHGMTLLFQRADVDRWLRTGEWPRGARFLDLPGTSMIEEAPAGPRPGRAACPVSPRVPSLPLS